MARPADARRTVRRVTLTINSIPALPKTEEEENAANALSSAPDDGASSTHNHILKADDLRAKGWIEATPGVWQRPHPNPRPLGPLAQPEPKQNPIPTLVKIPKGIGSGKKRVVAIVTLIRSGLQELDDDNLAASFKPLRDSIATSLGIEDNDRRVLWRYAQAISPGVTGTIVKIDCIDEK